MEIKLIKTLWGYTESDTTLAELARIKAAGFDGVEWAAPSMAPARWKDLLAEHDLIYCGQIFAFTADEFAEGLARILEYGPTVVTSHDGRDKMTFDEGQAYFREVLKAERDHGVQVAHETHRHRLLYTPWSTQQYLEAFPELRVCADFSHWCVVTESLLKDVEDMVTLACERTIHVHGRVGWEEGAQVSDPRAPEYQHYLERHEEWWDRIFTLRREAGAAMTTFDPEFGPPGYMPTLPYTRQPIADLWDVHAWMAERVRTRFVR